MRVVVQRVARASVTVQGRVTGSIGRGLLVLVGFAPGDTPETVEWMADKVAGLRIFADGDGKMNLDVGQVAGSLLVVSQFTLYGDASKGRRPSFVAAAPPGVAVPLYQAFIARLKARRLPVETGEFGAMMDVELVNQGPVTLILER
jgi:D-tyrosyl-tRNA(Tyr) deacylase